MRTSLISLAAALAWATPALADNGADQSAPRTDYKPSWTGETIVVIGHRQTYAAPDSASATRTDTPLINVPQSVQVLTHKLIDEQDRRTLGEALVNVSCVTPTRSDEVLFIPPILRGFPAEVYLDGLPVFAGNQQAFDPEGLVGVERIEVLKGPSATLYGGGLGTPLGGLINVESERPNDKAGGFVAMRAGSFDTWNPYGDINLPLSSGVSARIAAEYQHNASWIDKITGDKWSVQPSLSVQIDPATDLLLQGQFNHRRQLEYSGLPADTALAGALDRNAFPGSPLGQPRTRNDNNMGTVTLRHRFTDTLKLTVSSRYYASAIDESGSFVDPDFFPNDPATPTVYPVAPVTMVTRTKEATLDANLAATVHALGGTHDLLAGVNYDRTSFISSMGLMVSNTPEGTINLAHPVYDLTFTPQLPVNSTENDHYTTFAGYVQDQATYGRLHVTGALRVTSLKFDETSDYGVANSKTYTHLSPRIGATFDVVPGVALFAGYATAFRAAFAFIGRAAPKPESARTIEGGVKLGLTSIGLSGVLAWFDQTHDNVATPDPTYPGFSIQAGQQRARGLEADVVWEPTPAFSLLANYAYTDAKVAADNAIPVGSLLARVPKSSGRLAARYRILHGPAKGLSFGAGITAFTARQLTLPNTIAVPGYAAIDAQAAYEIGRFALSVSVVNLGGRRAWDPYSYFGNAIVAPNQPRSAFVTLKARL